MKVPEKSGPKFKAYYSDSSSSESEEQFHPRSAAVAQKKAGDDYAKFGQGLLDQQDNQGPKKKKTRVPLKALLCIPVSIFMKFLSILMIADVVYMGYLVVWEFANSGQNSLGVQKNIDTSVSLSVFACLLKLIAAIIMAMFTFTPEGTQGRKCCPIACYLSIVAQLIFLPAKPMMEEEGAQNWRDPCLITGAYVLALIYCIYVSKKFATQKKSRKHKKQKGPK